MTKGTQTISVVLEGSARERGPEVAAALVIAWSHPEPHRVGEIAFVSGEGDHTLGRGEGDGERRVAFYRQRPKRLERTPPLAGVALSRRQLVVRALGAGLEVERVGRCAMSVNGRAVDRATLAPGDTLYLRGQLLLFCAPRPESMPSTPYFAAREYPPFGEADRFGILGESVRAWELRDRLAFVAAAGKHVLLLGPSGTGKELAARAVHGLSTRASKPFVSRNAATLPSGLIDAELFGNARNYPNPGMAERAGLVGEANGGTLFLDELAELPQEQQAHLLRVLDSDGEYQRLGESGVRRSTFTLVGATNRGADALKHDVLARLPLRVDVPALEERREDIPLLIRHLLLAAAKNSPKVAERFVSPGPDGRPQAQVDPALVEALLVRPYATGVRELDHLLWRAISSSKGETVMMADELRVDSKPKSPAAEPTAEAIRAAVRAAGGNVTAAAQALGMTSRYALYRLMKKHGIAGDARETPEDD